MKEYTEDKNEDVAFFTKFLSINYSQLSSESLRWALFYCMLGAKEHLKFQTSKCRSELTESFSYLFQIQIARLISNLNEQPLLNDMSNARLSYGGSIMPILSLKTSKWQIFSRLKIALFLFQTTLWYHQWREQLWKWYQRSSKAFDLSLPWGAYDECREW